MAAIADDGALAATELRSWVKRAAFVGVSLAQWFYVEVKTIRSYNRG